MVWIQSCRFELVLALLYFQIPIFLADDVELTDHIKVLNYIIGVDIEGEDMFATLISTDAFLELKFAFARPLVTGV